MPPRRDRSLLGDRASGILANLSEMPDVLNEPTEEPAAEPTVRPVHAQPQLVSPIPPKKRVGRPKGEQREKRSYMLTTQEIEMLDELRERLDGLDYSKIIGKAIRKLHLEMME